MSVLQLSLWGSLIFLIGFVVGMAQPCWFCRARDEARIKALSRSNLVTKETLPTNLSAEECETGREYPPWACLGSGMNIAAYKPSVIEGGKLIKCAICRGWMQADFDCKVTTETMMPVHYEADENGDPIR